VVITPVLVRQHYPPQLGILLSILLVAMPALLIHLQAVRKGEGHSQWKQVNGFRNRLPASKLALFVSGLVLFSFLVWIALDPLNRIITQKFLSWLPGWFTVQDFHGYSRKWIIVTLVLNLVINGLIAPVIEEYYFRGYLLARMETWGKNAFAINAIFFSLYHLWQPQVWLTLVISLLPMTYLVWKTGDLRIGIYTHCLLNLVGALLTFGLVNS
jgi:membrane protease YdiL (CAAX protease family)